MKQITFGIHDSVLTHLTKDMDENFDVRCKDVKIIVSKNYLYLV